MNEIDNLLMSLGAPGGLPGMPAATGAPLSLAPPMAPSGVTEEDKLAQMFRGIKAPAAPEIQRLGLPSNAPAPRAPTPVKGGDLIQMLQLLGMGGGATAKNDYQLPSTLGAALRGRG